MMRIGLALFIACSCWNGAIAQNPLEHQKAAQAALQSQLGQDGAGCSSAKTTYDGNVCMANVLSQTERDFTVFYDHLEALLGTDPSSSDFYQAQKLWEDYREASCKAVERFHANGTIAITAELRCRVALTRSRMRDLDDLYHTMLHD
ncbi:MAG: lysozyme inhibitor LprI family protein [Terriglobales bacterium]